MDGAQSGLHVIDFGDPVSPQRIETCPMPTAALQVRVSGEYAFTANSESGMQVIQVYQSELDGDDNSAQPLAVNSPPDSVMRARLTATQTGDVTLELSADGGANWQRTPPDGRWGPLVVPGLDLVWRATLSWEHGLQSAVTGLRIDWSDDDDAPPVPTGFTAAYNTGSGNLLSWDPCPASDFRYFYIYRSDEPEFLPSPSEFVDWTTGTSWNDPSYDGWSVYYKITALESVDNQSGPASPEVVTSVGSDYPPREFALYQNVPNPFNPSTTIRYDVPANGGVVSLRLYDVAGRLVCTLVDGLETPGEKRLAF